ncbi:hypothetical protein NOCA170285 [metagenome]|uniref:Uncharacterized protein n=1 Tax=metagenome TaxID=256318 RepID=A0A2P2CK46_9ZZZZ
MIGSSAKYAPATVPPPTSPVPAPLGASTEDGGAEVPLDDGAADVDDSDASEAGGWEGAVGISEPRPRPSPRRGGLAFMRCPREVVRRSGARE